MKTKLQCVVLICVAIVLGIESTASADPIGYTVSLTYVKSYKSSTGTVSSVLQNSRVLLGDGTHLTGIAPNAAYPYHEFTMRVTATGLGTGQDLLSTQFTETATGSMSLANIGLRHYVPNNPTITVPADGVGNETIGYSYADTTPLFFINQFYPSTSTFVMDVNTGTDGSGDGNGTFGDIAWLGQYGEGGGTIVGTIYLTGYGSFSLGFPARPGYFQIISNNADGAGQSFGRSMPAYTGLGDSVIIMPEPSSFLLLGIGAIGLFAWRRRRQAA